MERAYADGSALGMGAPGDTTAIGFSGGGLRLFLMNSSEHSKKLK